MGDTIGKYSWNGIDLNALRQQMDKPADDAILSLYQSSSMSTLRAHLTDMAQNDAVVSDELPPEMSSFMKTELAYQFTDEDIRMFKQAHNVWRKYGMKFCFVLFFRSLPFTYMAEKPANVLRITQLLVTEPTRRIFETAQFVFDVMDRNWWEPDKRGILTAVKVRTMHAAMRYLILNDSDPNNPWNDAWGKPISQEDLIATNQTFSLEFLNGLKLIGEEMSASEQAAWFHTWKRIGQIMGVQDELVCKDIEEAWSLQHSIYGHLFNDEETISGELLSQALVETMSHFMMTERLVLHIMRRMLADELFPNCFHKMLEPIYGEKFPILFEQHQNEADKEDHSRRLIDEHHQELISYYKTIRAKREEEGKRTVKMKWWQKLLAAIGLYKLSKGGLGGLFSGHFGILHKVLHRDEVMKEKLEEEDIIKTMSAIGGIMLGILSKHFRKGKQSGFRIPEDLQEHWELD